MVDPSLCAPEKFCSFKGNHIFGLSQWCYGALILGATEAAIEMS